MGVGGGREWGWIGVKGEGERGMTFRIRCEGGNMMTLSKGEKVKEGRESDSLRKGSRVKEGGRVAGKRNE